MTEQVQRKTLGIAVASLVLGCFFIIPLIGLICGMIALVLGIIALVKINSNKQTLKGSGMAISGIVLGAVGLFVMPIIMLMMAIAVPNLVRARSAANESVAVAALKTIASAAYTYRSEKPGFPKDLSSLYNDVTPPLIDAELAGGIKHGYNFRLDGNYMDLDGNYQGFTVNVWPVSADAAGVRRFYIDTSGIIRCNLTGNATATDPPLE